ncbi:MAG: type IV toxin-antitoxin system AbiEi family antitoxin domain-containing protein [Solirubrobacteraceae bacterium]
MDERIATIAARQRGRVSRRQLSAAGIHRDAIRRRVAAGRLIERHRGVFAVGHDADVELGAETAALLACRDGAALSHLSAAWLWGLVVAPPADGAVEITVTRGRGPALTRVRVHRASRIGPDEIRIHRGLPVTSPARTLLEIAPLTADRSFELAYDHALVHRLLTARDVMRTLERAGGHPGRRRLRRLLAAAAGAGPTVTRSEAEERVLKLIDAAGLPRPLVNTRLHGYEVDFHWPQQQLVLEVDGYRFHSTRRAFEHDRRKDAALAAAGIATMRVTWRQLESEPLAVIARLAQALTRGGPHPR